MGSLYQHFYSAGLWLYFLAKQVSHLAQRDITLTQHGQRGFVHYPAHQYKFFPLGLRSPEQQGEPGVALIIFMAFIVSGVVPSLVSRHRWLNTYLPGWQSTRHPPTFTEPCSYCCISSRRCHRWHVYFWLLLFYSFCCSYCCCCFKFRRGHLVIMLLWKSSTGVKNSSLLKCFTLSTLFGNHNVCITFFSLFQRHTHYVILFDKCNYFSQYSHEYILCEKLITVLCCFPPDDSFTRSHLEGNFLLMCLKKIYLEAEGVWLNISSTISTFCSIAVQWIISIS